MTRLSPSLLLVATFVLASCAIAPPETSEVPQASTFAAPSDPGSPAASESAAAIVGEWHGQHVCQGIIDALTAAGFDMTVAIENVVGNGLVPGVESPDDVDPADPCADAVAIDHSHVFTADGRFSSLDGEGEEVDFGTWAAVDADTIIIGAPDRADVTFDYVVDGGRLTLEPELEEGCSEFECQWAVMVAMPWSDMERVDG